MPNVKDKALTLEDLKEALVQTGNALPAISSSDEGKIMRVDSEGNWSAENLPAWSGESEEWLRVPPPVTVTIATTTNNNGAHIAIRSSTGFSNYFCINTSAYDAPGEYMLFGGMYIDFSLANASSFGLNTTYRKSTAEQYGSSTMTASGSTVVRSGDVFKVWSLDFLEESYEQGN